jgi:hypothetical protein
MTEMNPLGTVARVKRSLRGAPNEQVLSVRASSRELYGHLLVAEPQG